MDLETDNTIRIALFFFVPLILISGSWPKYGTPLAVLWAGIVFWQWFRQRKQ